MARSKKDDPDEVGSTRVENNLTVGDTADEKNPPADPTLEDVQGSRTGDDDPENGVTSTQPYHPESEKTAPHLSTGGASDVGAIGGDGRPLFERRPVAGDEVEVQERNYGAQGAPSGAIKAQEAADSADDFQDPKYSERAGQSSREKALADPTRTAAEKAAIEATPEPVGDRSRFGMIRSPDQNPPLNRPDYPNTQALTQEEFDVAQSAIGKTGAAEALAQR